jgi:hypothetical protein
MLMKSLLLAAVSFGAGLAFADTDLTNPGSTYGGTDADWDGPVIETVQAIGILDDFNRADGPIGSQWTDRAGTFSIVSQAAQGGLLALATYNGATSNTLEADVEATGTALQYVGLVLGYADITNNYFLKVQQQDGLGTFDHAACYYGNNGTGFGLGFFPLDAPFTRAHMKVSLSGSTVTMTFSQIDGGTGSQTYVCNGAPSSGGNGIGIAGYDGGYARIDNFAGEDGSSPYTVVQTTSVPDVNGNGYPEEATLILVKASGLTQVWIRDTVTKAIVKKIDFGPGYQPISVTATEDTSGNGHPEIGVTVLQLSTKTYRLLLRDAKSGAVVRTMNLP